MFQKIYTQIFLLNDNVNAAMEGKSHSNDIDIIIVNNQSHTKDVSTLENSIFSGVILVVLVLMFFLGVRNALFVGLSILINVYFIILQLLYHCAIVMILFFSHIIWSIGR